MQRVWQEFFAILRIILSIVIWFLVELFKFLAKHIFQPLVIAVVMYFGDYVIKPLLSVLFNGFLQPFSIFWWNVFTGMRHMFNPIGEILRRIFEQLAMLFRSIRLFEVTYVSGRQDGIQEGRIQTVWTGNVYAKSDFMLKQMGWDSGTKYYQCSTFYLSFCQSLLTAFSKTWDMSTLLSERSIFLNRLT